MSLICQECVGESGLQKYVEVNGEAGRCSFCGKEVALAAETEEVVGYTMERILANYEDPAKSVMHVSRDGGYQLPTMESWELLEKLGLDRAHEDFFQCVEKELESEGGVWVQQDPYASPYHKQLGYDWEKFSRAVKHRARFTFFRSDDEHMRDGDTAVQRSHEVLDLIGSVVEVAGAFLSLTPEDRIYRGRARCPGGAYSTMVDLGPPPCEKARQSRMSPAGISMFYGALQAGTVVAELAPKPGQVVSLGVFKPRRNLVLVDFSKAAWEASIFAYESNLEPEAAAFLNRFAREIAKPVERDDRVHVEYVPTQVVTEYFRFLFWKEHSKVDGVAYRSSLRKGGVNVVLFLEEANCAELLELESSERVSIPGPG